jgi:hypothetical protein
MKRPGIVTGIALFNLMGALSVMWFFDRRVHMGVDPVFLGSAFPARWQWNWAVADIGLALVATVGLFRGWNWARWLWLALCVAFFIISAPVGDTSVLPSFLLSLAGSALAYWIVFFSPPFRLYFSRPKDSRPAVTIRGVISALLLALAVFVAHSIIMGVFRRTVSVEIAWIGTGVFILPILLIALCVRWHLETSLREISAFMLSVAVFFIFSISLTFLMLRFAYSDQVMPYFGWLHCVLLTLAFGIGGLLLLAYTRQRYRAAPA